MVPVPNIAHQTKRIPSVVPIFVFGGIWAAYALLFPMYRWKDFIIAFVLAIVGYQSAKHKFPGRVVEVPPPKVSTGDKDTDTLIEEGRAALAELSVLGKVIEQPEITSQVEQMTQVGERIFLCVAEDPRKAPQIRRFMQYYLPTTTKLLRSYLRMDGHGVAGDNISSTMEGIRGILGTIAAAFAKLLDTLMQGEALDVSTDIVVLQGMLAQEGLTEQELESKP